MNARFNRCQSSDRNGSSHESSGNDAPFDDGLVAVLASRESVIAAAAAMGHQPADGPSAARLQKAESTQRQASSDDEKKCRDKDYRRKEREADAKGGIKSCPVKFPAELHQPLRQRVNESNAPEGSRALLAITSFSLRPEFTDILHAIELRDDREDLIKTLLSMVQADWVVKIVIRLFKVALQPTAAVSAQIPALVETILRSPTLVSAIFALSTSETLQQLCIQLDNEPQLQSQFLHLATQPEEADFLVRMKRLSLADMNFLLMLLNLDPAAKVALAAAAPYPEITRLIVKAGQNLSLHAAIHKVVSNPDVAKTGMAVFDGNGLIGWIARKAVGVLLRRQHQVH